MNKMPSSSPDLTKENIEKLKELFPEILTDGEQIDFDKLKTILGQEVNGEKERYSFNWYGKKDAILGAQKPSKGTLRPDKEKSENFDTTENLYIEGDNLEVLKLLQKSYINKIKMIYIDPPYNTGNDFIYNDDFQRGIDQYLEYTEQKDESGNIRYSNLDTSGRYHTDWINMMYPRLKLMKNLLKEDGIIFVSINDAEFCNLQKIMNEIFGESNFLANLIWDKNHSAQAGVFKVYHEYVLVYAKDIKKLGPAKSLDRERFEAGAIKKESGRHSLQNFIFPKGTKIDLPHGEEARLKSDSVEKVEVIQGRLISEHGYLKEDVELRGAFTQVGQMHKYFYGDRDNLFDSKGQKIIEFYLSSSGKPKVRKERSVTSPQTTMKIGNQGQASDALAKLFGLNETPFSSPKPVLLIENFIRWFTNENDIIADFFSGSSTTAEAIIKVNNEEEKSKRRFILTQYPENLETGYKYSKKDSKRVFEVAINYLNSKNKPLNICELGIERIDLSLKKYNELTGGYKYFKLCSSNIIEWNSDFEDLEDSLFAYENVFVEGRSELDVVYEIMLKNGLELTYNVNQFEHDGKNVYDIAYGNLFICLADNIDVSVAQEIIDKRTEHGIDTSSVVFKDAGFKNDADKLNVIELLKDSGYPEENILTI